MSGNTIGIYIHVPFCDGKCPYCDFYSTRPDEQLKANYVSSILRELEKHSAYDVDTIYFGGGTPTLLGAELFVNILSSIRKRFAVASDAEITLEMNPRTADLAMLKALRKAGFNRISIGMQSGVDSELADLGRRHSLSDVRQAVSDARTAGFDNLSLDLMLGIPGQTKESLAQSIDAVCGLEPEHVSAYILKIEPETPFARIDFGDVLADDDMQAELYELAVEQLALRGYHRYEISNFARDGKISRHNTRYWDCGEYLGFGPAAHSFHNGRRFFYPRDLEGFINSPVTVDDGDGGSEEEYLMLRLRLAEGLTHTGWQERFGTDIPDIYFQRAEYMKKAGLVEIDDIGIRLCGSGFLLSNAVIARLLDE